MIFESLRGNEGEAEGKSLGGWALIVQGIATSIDALSVGFTIASYNAAAAFVSSLIIGIVTFIICVFGLKAGKTIGPKLSGKAEIFGGAILIFIGIEILVKSFL